jgi:hypothetical protein
MTVATFNANGFKLQTGGGLMAILTISHTMGPQQWEAALKVKFPGILNEP